jgi:dynein regulatory complex protein 1
MSRLIQERRDMEAKFQEDMMAKKEEFAKCLEDIRDVDGEEYNNLKVRLETDMQTLEQHHATMQAINVFSYLISLARAMFYFADV